MLPDLNSASSVAEQMMQDRLKRAERQRMLKQLPVQPSQRTRIEKRIMHAIGVRMMSIGRKLQNVGDNGVEYEAMGNKPA